MPANTTLTVLRELLEASSFDPSAPMPNDKLMRLCMAQSAAQKLLRENQMDWNFEEVRDAS